MKFVFFPVLVVGALWSAWSKDDRREISGSTPWRLTSISGDERTLEVEIRVDTGPGIKARVTGVRADETAEAVTVRVDVAQSYPPGETSYVTETRYVEVKLDEPLGDRHLDAAPVDEPFADQVPKTAADLGLPSIDEEY